MRYRRTKYFVADSPEAEAWSGPYDTIQDALAEGYLEFGTSEPLFVGTGRFLNKAEREDLGSEFEWEVDIRKLFKVTVEEKK